MTPEEARLNLDATTLRPQDTAPEARTLAAEDTALDVWRQSRQAFDEQVAGALEALPVPAGLKTMLLQLQPAIPETSTVPADMANPNPKKGLRRVDAALTILAGAAMLMVGAVAWWNWNEDRMPGWQRESLAVVRQIESGRMPLDYLSRDLGELQSLLARHHHPLPVSLPARVAAMPGLGCKTFHIGLREATVVCFEISPKAEAHLVVVNNEGLRDAPPRIQPQFIERDGWNIARWSDGGQCYLIATRAPKAALQRLFALMPGPAGP